MKASFFGIGNQEIDVDPEGSPSGYENAGRLPGRNTAVPGCEDLRLADVDHLAIGVLHQINARRARKALDLSPNIRRGLSLIRWF